MFSGNCSCRLFGQMSNLALIYPDAEREPSTSAGCDFSSAFIPDALGAKFEYAKAVRLLVSFQWSVAAPYSLGPPFAKMLIIRCRCNIDEILVRNHNLPRNFTRPGRPDLKPLNSRYFVATIRSLKYESDRH